MRNVILAGIAAAPPSASGSRYSRVWIPPLAPPGTPSALAGSRALLVHLARTLGVDLDAAALLLSGERVLAWSPRAKSLAGSDDSAA